jgi:hypothetical protein
MVGDRKDRSEDAEREVTVALAAAVLERVSPEELAILDDEAASYFANPVVAGPHARRDEPLGFGLDLTLVTPYALAVGSTVVNFLSSVVADEARDAARPVAAALIRRFFRRGPKVATEPSLTLTSEQSAQVRQTALTQAEQLGLPRERAELLADAVIGGLAVEGLR